MMHHFFADPSDIGDGSVALKGDEAHHATRVLRLRPGEQISIADGTGRVFEAVVTKTGEVLEAEIRSESHAEPLRPEIVLYQGVAKGERMDIAVQKAVEIGVRRIVPFMAERTVVHWDDRKRTRAHVRLQEIAKAAAKQSRSPWPTDVDRPTDVVAADASTIVLDADAKRRFRDVLPEDAPASIGLVIGPEGGLSPAEIELLTAAGAQEATLGDRVLRTETAGSIAAALVRFVYGSLG